MDNVALGIDLGTTNCVAAVYMNNKVEIIPNQLGDRTMPSVVAFNDIECVIGKAAKQEAVYNAKNTIYDSKRIIGRGINDPDLMKDQKLWPFKIINKEEVPYIEVIYKGETQHLSAEEISGMLLKSVKQYSNTYLGYDVDRAVITVPAYFNQAQREATERAGKIAGLQVLRIIHEPTAAALAYTFEKPVTEEKNILVFDFGGGTFDVSIVNIDPEKNFEVIATKGNNHLGGNDLNNLFSSYLINEFNTTHKCDIKESQEAVQRLQHQCEESKILLSTLRRTTIMIHSLIYSHNFKIDITRNDFEKCCDPLFQKLMKLVEEVIVEANMSKEKIDDVVLVGGSTRIPKIQEMLKAYFNKDVISSINADEAVAYGAAVQAAMITGSIDNITLMDITSLSLGLKVDIDDMAFMIRKNTKIPFAKTRVFYTKHDYQTSVSICIYEGENCKVQYNNLLGKFKLTGFKNTRKGLPIEITFHINHSGILKVTAKEYKSKSSANLTIDTKRRKNKTAEEQSLDAEDIKIIKEISIIEQTNNESAEMESSIEMESTNNESIDKRETGEN